MDFSEPTVFLVNSTGQRISIPSRIPLKIGRDPDNDLSIPDDSLSRHHAVITVAGGKVLLQDLGSSNGTYTNGLRLREAPLVLSDGDSIRLGGMAFTIRIQENIGNRGFCTKCGRPMAVNVTRCSFCGSERSTFIGESTGGVSRQGSVGPNSRMVAPAAGYELPLLLIPIGASFIAWSWIGNMNLIQGPQSWLGLLSALTVLSTAAIAAAEASKVGMTTDRARGIYAPLGWFLAMLFIWAVAYPVYLFKRRYFGLRNRVAYGLGAALLFLLTITFLGYAIGSAKIDLQENLRAAGATAPSSGSDSSAEPESASGATPGASSESTTDLNDAMILVRPGIGDLGGMKVGDFLDCLKRAPNPSKIVSESDKGYGRHVFRLENNKAEWMELNFRLTGSTAVFESLQVGDGTSEDDWQQLLLFVEQVCSASAPSPTSSPR